MGLMPSGIRSVVVKIIAAFPTNQGTEYDTHQGIVVLFDAGHGLPRAIVDGTMVTAIRTAAVSGAGTQARTHLEAMLAVRRIRRVRAFSLPLKGAHAFAERQARRHGIAVAVMDSARAAVEGADIVCTVTSAREPVVLEEWLAPGTHINAVDAFTPATRELDTAAVVKSRLYVDRRQSTVDEAGEFLIPKREGAIGDDHIVGELGELLLGQAPGRGSVSEITLFKSLGIAIEDLAAAHHIVAAWPAAGNRAALATIRRVYPQAKLCKNVIELNFRPGNPGVHVQITLPKAEFFFERARVFRFYGEVSMCASKLTDAHDVDRMKVATAYDCTTDTWPEDCHRIYELEGKNLYELHDSPTDRHAQKWNQIEEIERLLVEDICYSFIPMEELARVAGLTTPVTTAMTDLTTVFTGYDYRANGLTLEKLGLAGMIRDQIIEYATTGRAP